MYSLDLKEADKRKFQKETGWKEPGVSASWRAIDMIEALVDGVDPCARCGIVVGGAAGIVGIRVFVGVCVLGVRLVFVVVMVVVLAVVATPFLCTCLCCREGCT